MFILDRIEIEGLWGQRNIKVNCFPDVNFFVGVNGSGKTTVVNLIAAALKADYLNLQRVNFRQLRMNLKDPSNGTGATITVRKMLSDNARHPFIEYEIQNRSEKPETYTLDERDAHIAHGALTRRDRERLYLDRKLFDDFRQELNVSWLSIHRANFTEWRREDTSYESTIDRKLAQLTSDFGRYFSSLNTVANKRTELFQQKVLLTLLTEPSKAIPAKTVNYAPDREALKEILESLRLLTEHSLKTLTNLFKSIETAQREFYEEESIDEKNIAALFAADQIHRIIPLWNRLVKERDDIYNTKNLFLEVLNELLIKKKLLISDENILEAITVDDQVLKLTELSSGEKQLIIILGEALLNHKGPWIYIADEPELSLHVRWQEQLIPSLLKVNPRAQLLFATHSPDIVSVYQNRVLEMEHIRSDVS